MLPTWYEVLGVEPNASSESIQTAYRSAARLVHPDSPGAPADAEERMASLNSAYETLSDPLRRRTYDLGLSRHKPRADAGHDEQPGVVENDGSEREETTTPSSPLSAAIALLLAFGVVTLAFGFVAGSGGLALLGALMLIASSCLTSWRFVQAMRAPR